MNNHDTRSARTMTVVSLVSRLVLMAASPTLPAQSSNAANGAELYLEYGCYACHGYSGHGGRGPALGPDALAYDGFAGIVRAGRRGMPAYSAEVAPDADLADIHAFLKTVPASPEVKDIPLLKGGAGVYTR